MSSSSDPTVCALALRTTPELEDALADQNRAPDVVIRHDAIGPGLARAGQTGADWIWIVDGCVMPRPGALAALLAGADRAAALAAPVVLCGVVRKQDGDLDRRRTCWYPRVTPAASMAAAAARLVPIRAAAEPLLVHSCALGSAGPRARLDPAGAVLEWTARLLGEHAGFLVPESESVAVAAPSGPSPSALAALILGGSFSGTERIRAAAEIGERRAVLRPGG